MTQSEHYLTDANNDALDELIAAATPAPWNFAPAPNPETGNTKAEYVTGLLTEADDKVWTTFAPDPQGDPEDYIVPALTGDGPTSEANAAFIANARNLLPLLLAEVRELRARRDDLRRAADALEACPAMLKALAQVQTPLDVEDTCGPVQRTGTIRVDDLHAVLDAAPEVGDERSGK